MKILITLSAFLFASIASGSPIIVDANGRFAGFYQGPGPERVEFGVSAKGYRFGFNRESGRLAEAEGLGANQLVFFESADCSGIAYLQAPNNQDAHYGIVLPAARPEYPLPLSGDPPVYYLPQSPRPTTATVVQRTVWRFNGGQLQCVQDLGAPSTQAYPLLPNDPVETGLEDSHFDGPMRVMSSLLFRDGFESASFANHGNSSLV